jgi:two-component system, NarL family, nitrate/nitrite response regulator NarL
MRFIIADDHPLYLEAAQGLVTRHFADAQVQAATTVDGVLELLSGAGADIVMLDYSMPGMAGTEGLRRVIALATTTPVVVMSGVANRQNVLDCIAAGAKGYIPKTLEGPMFMAALTLVIGGATYVPTEFAMTGAGAAPEAAPATSALDDAFYSSQELAMLRMLVAGASNKEMARSFSVQEVTIKYHLSRLYRRLHVSNRAQAVAAAVNAGITAAPAAGPKN